MSRPLLFIEPALLQGLRPKQWLCAGQDYSREDLKQWLLTQVAGLTQDSVTDLKTLAASLLGVPRTRVLTPTARREALRLLMRPKAIHHRLVELKRLKRQRSFFRKLDRAVQQGRLAFAHENEAQVLAEHLEARLGPSALRAEMDFLGHLFEAWLEASDLWDEPRLYLEATEVLRTGGWPTHRAKPERMLYLSAVRAEPRVRAFLETLKTAFQIEETPVLTPLTGNQSKPSWELWHTLDDAAERVAEAFATGEADLKRDLILIPDDPVVKRTLRRALEQRGVPLADPRDPMGARKDEELKSALLPLELVASRYERESVVSWIRAWRKNPLEWREWTSEIYARGIHEGLASYEGGKLVELHRQLIALHESLSGRMRLEVLGQKHLEILKKLSAPSRVLVFFERFWSQWSEEWAQLKENHRRVPLLYWWERLRERWESLPAWVGPLRPSPGARVYRISQAPPPAEVDSGGFQKLWCLGLSAQDLDVPCGDYWFSSRDREILSQEYQVSSRILMHEDRKALLGLWMQSARAVQILDAEWDFDGKERESLLPLLKELQPETEFEAIACGAHPRWLPSLLGIRPVPPQLIELGEQIFLKSTERAIDASCLDHYSRCAFQAIGFHRWKLRDLKEPDIELPPEVRGVLLHDAVERLIRSRDPQGVFSLTAEQALEEAWSKKRPRGLLQGTRLQGYIRKTLIEVLDEFCIQETAYVKRSQTRILSLEHEAKLECVFPEGTIRGRPDRIDEHADGVFVIDYKTTTSVPSGKKMLEDGYRLQLPFYAIAAERAFNRPALGVQFVSLVPKGGRGRGVFFQETNGKTPGSITQVTKANTSLLFVSKEEVWNRFELEIRQVLSRYFSGVFKIGPKDPVSECRPCSLRDVCGRSRLVTEAEDQSG